jgi:hypothetical protein
MDPNGEAVAAMIVDGLCSNCTILAGKPGLVFEDGSEAGPSQGIYLHHIVSSDFSKKSRQPVSKCPINADGSQTRRVGGKQQLNEKLGAELFAQGDDNSTPFYFTSEDGTYKSGFFVGPQDKFTLQADLVNYNEESKVVYVTYDIEYVEGHVGADAVATLLNVAGCGQDHNVTGSAIALSKTGPAVTESKRFAILADGKIISASRFQSRSINSE